MVTFFIADPAQVRWELTNAAVLRQHQLEDVLEASRAEPVTRGWTR
jgi:hypothetical protein